VNEKNILEERCGKMKRALLVIDVQNEYFSGGLPVSCPQGSINNIFNVDSGAESAF
jgi:nicotinamidase-related amidase